MIDPHSVNNCLPLPERVLVIGSGGRENALAWALTRNNYVQNIWITPGNGGTEEHPRCCRLSISETDSVGLIDFCLTNKVNLIIIGPETPLAEGLADKLRRAELTVFGPGAEGAKLEASKAWAKDLMVEAGIPTAKHWAVNSSAEAKNILRQQGSPLVVKADGLAGGKGVTVAETIDESSQAIEEAFDGRFGEAGTQLVLEEKLSGPEVSVFALCDGKRFIILPPAQDHKRLKEGDLGPNTGGMGAYVPAPLLDAEGLETVKNSILNPTLEALKSKGIDYRGVIYAGLILTKSGPKVIEFNCRFGDPECQALMPLMGPELAQVLQACALGCLDLAPKLLISDNCSACVVVASAGYPEAPRTNFPMEIQLKPDCHLQLFHAGTSCNSDGKFITAGGRVLSVVAQAKDFDSAFMNVYKGLQQIHFKGMTFRRDIGYQVRHS